MNHFAKIVLLLSLSCQCTRLAMAVPPPLYFYSWELVSGAQNGIGIDIPNCVTLTHNGKQVGGKIGDCLYYTALVARVESDGSIPTWPEPSGKGTMTIRGLVTKIDENCEVDNKKNETAKALQSSLTPVDPFFETLYLQWWRTETSKSYSVQTGTVIVDESKGISNDTMTF